MVQFPGNLVFSRVNSRAFFLIFFSKALWSALASANSLGNPPPQLLLINESSVSDLFQAESRVLLFGKKIFQERKDNRGRSRLCTLRRPFSGTCCFIHCLRDRLKKSCDRVLPCKGYLTHVYALDRQPCQTQSN